MKLRPANPPHLRRFVGPVRYGTVWSVYITVVPSIIKECLMPSAYTLPSARDKSGNPTPLAWIAADSPERRPKNLLPKPACRKPEIQTGIQGGEVHVFEILLIACPTENRSL